MSERDALGLRRHYVRARDGAQAGSLWALCETGARLDPAGVRAAWGQGPESGLTCVAGVALQPRAPWPAAAAGLGLKEALHGALERILASGARPVLALSGGVDSALVLALAREAGRPFDGLVTLESELPGYDEAEEAESVARALGYTVERVRVATGQYADALPEAIAATEAPLYNLHPVTRLLLSRILAARGFSTLVTGDAADQVFAGTSPHLYLPLVAALSARGGMALASPFFDTAVLGVAAARPADPQKGLLRALALELGVPRAVVERAKRPRLTPPVSLSAHRDAAALARVASAVGLTASEASDAEHVGWTTLVLFAKQLEARS